MSALFHHVYSYERLREAYWELNRRAAAGVDEETWEQYGEDLEARLQDLSSRLRRGAYRAPPVRRTYVPKGDGRRRAIGIPTLEDRIVQRAFAEVLGAVYEGEFKGFSYGYRPGRSQHQALDAVHVGIERKRINWVLEADVRGCYDALDHGRLVQLLEYRISDRRVIRHVKKWLRAGVLEAGQWSVADRGTPQGGGVSPVLANVYLHHAIDIWAATWRREVAEGDVIIVRYADDFVVGFEHRQEAERFVAELRQQLAEYGLELSETKTRLVEFGRFAASHRRGRGEGKPETFDFLGFTHYCSTDRRGRFALKRRTVRKRLRSKLKSIRMELRRRCHGPVPQVGAWLRSVLVGHYRYYGVPHNYAALNRFYEGVCRHWRRALRRRSQRGSVSWPRMRRLAQRWLPRPKIYHPYPSQRLCVRT